ncbi:hypothetical protein A0U40_13390 [[Bacillus] sp. KCTC 13219]|nr:hypothetical protein A0U40_13390 [[Bacillus] sp. KCTC 13219]
MNLQKLFEMQAELDEHIIQQHPELRGQNNLDWKLLALQVELGECANEWRGFKKWSNDQEPRATKRCVRCAGEGKKYDCYFINKIMCDWCEGTGSVGNPLLEEYVDCLHFILSIGLELNKLYGFEPIVDFENGKHLNDITKQFNNVFSNVSSLYMTEEDEFYDNEDRQGIYEELFELFIHLGQSLGFVWEEVEQAYFAKNKTNHERQLNGY